MKVAVFCAFDVNSAANGSWGAEIAADLPIVMTSNLQFSFPADSDTGNTESFVSKVSAAIAGRHAVNQPASDRSLQFDRTVFANLSQANLPILRLRHLTLPVGRVDEQRRAS